MQDDHSAGAKVAVDPAPASAAQADATPQPGALAVLVVDDDRVVGQMMADGLVAMGHAVVTAHSADEARLVLQHRHDIGVVVSDIRMPGRDGLALALDVASELEDARAAAMVLITGHATAKEVDAAMRQGAAEFLRKPCRLADLVGAVERGMAKARTRRGNADRTDGAG